MSIWINMKEINFKPLYPEQIEVRPADTRNGTVTLLLYIDSRCAANILNEAVGEFNWQIEYKDVAGQIYGRLSIWDDDRKIWVYKEDTGNESNIDGAKGRSSDILKRCLARWGCDYLYTSPRIKIDAPSNYYYQDKMTMTFYVKEIQYYEKRIVRLVIADRFDNVVFDWDYNKGLLSTRKPVEAVKEEKGTTTVLDGLKAFCGGLKPTADKQQLLRFYKFYEPKAQTWRGTMDYKTLWERWLAKATA